MPIDKIKFENRGKRTYIRMYQRKDDGFDMIRSVTFHHTGWYPDTKDPRDLEYELTDATFKSFFNVDVSDSEKRISNVKYFNPVSDQYQFPSCVANSVADTVEAYHTKKNSTGRKMKRCPDLSRMFVWWNARHEMAPDKSKDPTSGTYNRLGLDVACRFGIPQETIWPYDDARVGEYDASGKRAPRSITRPSISAYVNARTFFIDSYHPILSKGDKRLSLIVKSLQVSPGVIAGFKLDKSFFKYNHPMTLKEAFKSSDKSLVIPTPTDLSKGGHSMVIVGYDSKKKAFLVRNHWSTDWGIEGYSFIDEDYIANPKYVHSIWVVG